MEVSVAINSAKLISFVILPLYMNKFILGLIIVFFSYNPVFAQLGELDEAPADTLEPWAVELRGSLNGSQSSYSNWAQGGVNTLAVSAATNFNALYRKNKWGYDLEVGLLYGQAKIDDDFRKTEDEIRIRNTGRYYLTDERWSLVGSVNFRSQFDQGYDADREFVISNFMAPAFLTETVGISFKPVNYFSIDFGAAAQQTIVLKEGTAGMSDEEFVTYRERYGLRDDQSLRNELGFSFLLQFDRQLFENLRYVSTLETFTNVTRSLDRTDLRFHNELIGRINDFIDTTFRFTMLYNDDISDELQIRQTLSVGVSFRLI